MIAQKIGSMACHQRGYIFAASGAFHVRYYVTEIVEGKRLKKQRSHKRCVKDRSTGHGSPSAMAVRSLCEDFVRTINEREKTPQRVSQDLMVVDFWDGCTCPTARRNGRAQVTCARWMFQWGHVSPKGTAEGCVKDPSIVNRLEERRTRNLLFT